MCGTAINKIMNSLLQMAQYGNVERGGGRVGGGGGGVVNN